MHHERLGGHQSAACLIQRLVRVNRNLRFLDDSHGAILWAATIERLPKTYPKSEINLISYLLTC
jgi:hypothetical protein